jgi:hypothetical protein
MLRIPYVPSHNQGNGHLGLTGMVAIDRRCYDVRLVENLPEGDVKVNILEVTDSTLTLGLSTNWLRFLFDSRIVIDRDASMLLVQDKAFGITAERHIPIDSVDSVKMSVRGGRGYMLIQWYRVVPVTTEVRIDLWIDARELGRVQLSSESGLKSDVGATAVLGRRIAEYMQKPFIDTSRW